MTLVNGGVLVFARRPELGRVKTRLESAIGDHLTLSIYRAFLADTLTAARQTNARVILAHTPGLDFPEQALADETFHQQGYTFGERFDYTIKEAADRLPPETPFVLIGADTPHLSPMFLRKTLETLSNCDAVIGPNMNGGFYLLGFSKPPLPVRDVFDHTAAEEVGELIRLLSNAGLRASLLEPNFDVDLPEDLRNLIHIIDNVETRRDDWIPPNTLRVLQSAPLIPLAVQTARSGTRQKLAAGRGT